MELTRLVEVLCLTHLVEMPSVKKSISTKEFSKLNTKYDVGHEWTGVQK